MPNVSRPSPPFRPLAGIRVVELSQMVMGPACGGKVWYRKGSDIPESKFEDLVDMSFLEAAQAKFK